MHLSRLCIQFVFTDDTTKVLILGDNEPYWSENEIEPDFGSRYPNATRLLEKMKQLAIAYLYEEVR